MNWGIRAGWAGSRGRSSSPHADNPDRRVLLGCRAMRALVLAMHPERRGGGGGGRSLRALAAATILALLAERRRKWVLAPLVFEWSTLSLGRTARLAGAGGLAGMGLPQELFYPLEWSQHAYYCARDAKEGRQAASKKLRAMLSSLSMDGTPIE